MGRLYYLFHLVSIEKGKTLVDEYIFYGSINSIRKIAVFILLIVAASPTLYGQALFTETFAYNDGGLANCSQLSTSSPYYPLASSNVSGGIWVTTGPSSFPAPILVQTGALTYSGYSLSGSGKHVLLPAIISQSQSAYRTFTSSPVIYYTAMVRIDSAYNLDSNNPSDPDYDFNGTVVMGHGSSSSNYRGLLVYNRVSNSDPLKKIVAGISFIRDDPGTAFVTAKPLDTLQTHLIVVRTERATRTSKLWVNPDLSGPEPTPDAICTNLPSTDVVLDRLILYQRDSKPTSRIGGLRVATTWNDAVLPVELSSFSASIFNSNAKLSWQTATEINNYGFEVERCALSAEPQAWVKIGFVNGNGNSNSPKSYSFVDDKVSSGKHLYRLKQIDDDGTFEYSNEIKVDLGLPNQYELKQNYPNPFNPSTTIRYSLTKSSKVNLKVYNLIGQEVVDLVDENKEAGTYDVLIDASDLSSGVYFVKFSVEEFQSNIKISLIK